ncbi:MarR family winged helix-turn-helix transcriptional regulator [Oxalobacter sp. OttesenSCG-928-P03]|nr:MarR family winged helix-turn-helix transcriptional regulator [Oxalobacter sp. OttesenSCG-928-P03]
MKTAEQRKASPCYCIRLRRAAGRITDHYSEALSLTGLTVNQFSLLATLFKIEGCGTGQLAEAVGLEKSTLVRTLAPVIKAGYIRDDAPEKSRRRQLYLTPKGKETLAMATPLWQKAQAGIREKLGKKHQEIMALLDELDTL